MKVLQVHIFKNVWPGNWVTVAQLHCYYLLKHFVLTWDLKMLYDTVCTPTLVFTKAKTLKDVRKNNYEN